VPDRQRARHGARRSFTILLAAGLLVAGCSGGGGDGERVAEPDPIDEPVTSGERPVQVVGAGTVRLFGTLTVPPAAGAASVPGALLVPASGRSDRNGLIGETGAPDALAKDVARHLSDAGVVTYRYDRRGTGESKLEPDVRLTFDDLVADARAGLDLLAQRKETSGRDLAVVGYDQGGLVAIRLAATDSRVKRLVLISVPGRSVLDVQAAELAAAYGPESAEALRSTVAGLVATGTLPPLDAMRTELRPLLPPTEAPFLAQLYGLDASVEAARVTVPTLIVVPRNPDPYQPARLAAAIRGATVFTATSAGSTLQFVGPPPSEDPSDPASPVHDHGAATPLADVERDGEALAQVTGFLSAATAPRG